MQPDLLSEYSAIVFSATMLVKILIDVARMGFMLPKWAPPVIALCLGPVFILLLLFSGGTEITLKTLADCLIAGTLVAGGAVGVTELAKRALTPKEDDTER